MVAPQEDTEPQEEPEGGPFKDLSTEQAAGLMILSTVLGLMLLSAFDIVPTPLTAEKIQILMFTAAALILGRGIANRGL